MKVEFAFDFNFVEEWFREYFDECDVEMDARVICLAARVGSGLGQSLMEACVP